MTTRDPAVAGRFYQGTKTGLTAEVARFIDLNINKEECLGAVSPHAGYIYSGAVAGNVLSRINYKESIIVLGPNHTGIGKPYAISSSGLWHMPMGDISIDAELAGIILETSRHIKEDPSAHVDEHSIEVQLPFVQFMKKDIKFVPIIISYSDKKILKEIGLELADSIKKIGRPVVIISSSDMTHYETRESAAKKDKKAIDAMLNLDEDKLFDEITMWDISMCGFAPTIVMLSALKKLGAKKAELIDYKTSGDVSGDYSSVVGYAGIIIK